MTLTEFEIYLREKLEKYDKPRPFICGGNPLECHIFIVGINAATEMKKGFWDFWTQDLGFDKGQWFERFFFTFSNVAF